MPRDRAAWRGGGAGPLPLSISRAGLRDGSFEMIDGSSEQEPVVNAGRLPACEGLAGQATEEDSKAMWRSVDSRGSSPNGNEAPAERYRRAAQLLQGAFVERPGADAFVAQPLLRNSSAPVQHPCARRIISMEALPQCPEQPNVDGSTPRAEAGSMSTPRVEPGNSMPSNLRMRWSFSDAKVAPSLPVHLVAPTGYPRQVASPQNVVMSSSWTPPGVQPAWRSPRHSYNPPTSACSTPQAPATPVLMKPEMRASLGGSGTATPPAPSTAPSIPSFSRGTTSYAPLAFPRQPGVRSTVGVAQLPRPRPAPKAPAPVPPASGFVQVTGPPAPGPAPAPAPAPAARADAKQLPQEAAQAPRPLGPLGPLQPGEDTNSRQSLGRRMWRSGTHGKAIGPPSHHEKDENLTSVCIKLQHKLGKLSTKKTISL